MAQDPNEHLRAGAREAAAFRLAIERQMAQARADFEKNSAAMGLGFKQDVGDMVKSFRAFATDTSKEGSHLYNELKVTIRGMATFFPEEFKKAGLDVDKVFAEVSEGATRMSDAHIAKTAARAGRIRDILRSAGVEEEQIDTATHEVFARNIEGTVAYLHEYMQDRLQMFQHDKAMQEKIVAETQQKILKEVNTRVAAEVALEKKLVAAAKDRVKQTVTGAMGRNDVFGQLLRSAPGIKDAMKGVAKAEQESLIATGKAGGMMVNKLTLMQEFLQAGVGGFAKLAGSALPVSTGVGLVGFALEQVFEAFDRTKRQGASFAEVLAVQGDEAAASFTGLLSAGDSLRDSLYPLKKQLAGTGADVDGMSIKALGLAKSLGGLGDETKSVVVGLTQVGLSAAMAGLSAEQAMQLVARGQRAFGEIGKDGGLLKYFNQIRTSAHAAGLGTQEFMDAAGGIEEIGKMWGGAADTVIGLNGALTKLSASMTGLNAAQRGMAVGAFASLGRMPMMQNIALQMFAHGGTSADALRRIQGANAAGGRGMVAENIDAMRMALSRRTNLLKPGSEVQLAAFLQASPFGQMAGMSTLLGKKESAQSLIRALREPDKRNLGEVQKALEKAAVDEDPMRKGQVIAQSQLGTLQQIQDIVAELLELMRAFTQHGIRGMMGWGGSNTNPAAAGQIRRYEQRAIRSGRGEGG